MFNPVMYFRLANFLHRKGVPFVPKLLTYFSRFVFSCYLPHGVKAGENLVLGYGGLGIVIHERSIIGNNCHIDQNVTLGGTSKKQAVPILGNNVYVGAGAKIIGPVTIGNDVVIGANAVVVSDVEDNCVVVGVPARVIKKGIQMCDYV
ncbi:MAG: serine O-acetyltransferase [Desulfuromonadales bacterium]|nr:serine O-acetyltransferase [Desulfuromonadales bacterium]